MIARGALGAAGLAAGASTATTNGHVDLVGIAAIITSVVGAITLAWTIYQGTKRRSQLDAETVAEIIAAVEERKRGKR